MNTQDKEFDDLFRSKLDGFEVEPSAQVWAGIDARLDGKKRRSIIPMLSIAASMILLIAAAVLFIPEGENIKPGHPKKNGPAISRIKPVTAKPVQDTPVNTVIKKDAEPANIIANSRVAGVQHHTKKMEAPVTPAEQPAPVVVKQAPAKEEDQQLIAAAPTKPAEITTPVVPGPETQLSIKQPTTIETTGTNPTNTLTAAQPALTQQAKPVVKRHGIHNFGDLVNIVVAKVDKRKDKLIEFTDTDDDESTITAVNIGPVKIKKDK